MKMQPSAGSISDWDMHNPPHLGETLRKDVLSELGISVAEAARQLGVSRVALSWVLHGCAVKLLMIYGKQIIRGRN